MPQTPAQPRPALPGSRFLPSQNLQQLVRRHSLEPVLHTLRSRRQRYVTPRLRRLRLVQASDLRYLDPAPDHSSWRTLLLSGLYSLKDGLDHVLTAQVQPRRVSLPASLYGGLDVWFRQVLKTDLSGALFSVSSRSRRRCGVATNHVLIDESALVYGQCGTGHGLAPAT